MNDETKTETPPTISRAFRHFKPAPIPEPEPEPAPPLEDASGAGVDLEPDEVGF